MFKYKKRVLMEFDYLNNQTSFVTSKELAQEFNVSEKTIKNDMDELSQLCADSGAQLVSKRHYGYQIQVLDPEIYENVRNDVFIYFFSSGINSAKIQDERLLSILHSMLMSEDYLTVDTLAQQQYVTRTSIITKMKVIRKIISSYHLTIKKAQEEGPMIQGREYDIRLLMLDTIENSHYLNSIYQLRKMHDRWFRLDSEEERLKLRQILLTTLRENRYRLRDDTINKMSYYLCLVKKRYFSGYQVHFTRKEADVIRSFGIYRVISRMFIQMAQETTYPTDENEVLAMCLYIMTHMDGNSNSLLFPKRYAIRSKDLATAILCEINRWYGLNFMDDPTAYEKVIHTLIPILIQTDFGSAAHRYAYMLRSEEQMNPLATEFAKIAAMVYERTFGEALSVSNQMIIAALFSSLLVNERYPFRPLSIAITGAYGLNYSEIIRKIFISRFSRYIQTIDTYELYELRSYPKERFDVVVANFGAAQHGYRYEWPLFSFDNLPTDKDLNRFFNDFIICQLNLHTLIDRLDIPPINYYNDCKYSNVHDFIEMLSLKYGSNDEHAQMIRTYFQDADSARFDRGVLFLPLRMSGHPLIDIYKVFNKHDKSCSFRFFVVLSISFDGSFLKARLVHDFLTQYTINFPWFKKLIDQNEANVVEACLRESLKVLPITPY